MTGGRPDDGPLAWNVAGLLADEPGAERIHEVAGVAIDLDDLTLAEPISGRIRLLRTNRGILATGDLHAALQLECSRCLRDITYPVDVRIAEEYLPAIDLTTGRPLPTDDEPDIARLTDHHELDLETPVREAIQLAEPIAPLDRPDCPGLCIVCGLPLDEGVHDHPVDDIDPRLEALRGSTPTMADRRTVSSIASGALAFARSDQPIAAVTDRRRAVIAALLPIGVFLGFVAVRIASRPKLDFDEHIFLDVGRHLVDTGLPLRAYAEPGGPVLFFDHTPLYVYFVALMTAIGGPTDLLLRSTTLVFGVLTVLLVFLIGLELRGVEAALVGSILVAVNPFFVTYSWFVRMEVPMCCFMVLAIYLLIHERLFVAALAIATAVMLKEIALAFWLVAVLYVLVRRGVRAAAVVAWPTPVVLGVWLLYANEIGHVQLMRTIGRWVGSAEGGQIRDPRLHVGIRAWVNLVLEKVIGPVMIFAAGATAALVAIRRGPAPPIVAVPIVYVMVAIAASFVIRLKEPRFVVAIVPMIALSVALLVDWHEVWGVIRGTDRGPEMGMGSVTP